METSGAMQPLATDIDLLEGAMAEPDRHLVRRASDMRGYYADAAALERLILQHNDPVHYEVFEKKIPEERGHLLFCISRLQPGLVGEECFMTKGHYHSVRGTAEVYLCLRGRATSARPRTRPPRVVERNALSSVHEMPSVLT